MRKQGSLLGRVGYERQTGNGEVTPDNNKDDPFFHCLSL